MDRNLLTLLGLVALAALPFATAQDDTLYTPPTADLNVTDDNVDPDESTFAGMSTTVVIVMIVLAVLVVALIVAMASRP